MDDPYLNFKFLSWNVRGLNNATKQEDVKQVVNSIKPDLICFQETKLQNISTFVIRNCLGVDYENDFVFLPAVGTRGGS
jgi:exonuclease III